MFKNKKLVSVAGILIILGVGTAGYAHLHQPDPVQSPQVTYRGVTLTYPVDWQVSNKQIHTDSTHTVPSIGIHTKNSVYYVLATAKSTAQPAVQTGIQSEAVLISATRLKGLSNTFDLRWIARDFSSDTSEYSAAEFLMSSAQYSHLGWSTTKATTTVAGEAPAFKLPNGTELTVGTNSQDVYNTPDAAKAWFFTAGGKQAHAVLLSATLASNK